MTSKLSTALVLIGFLGLGGSALAQSLTAPAGRDPATAPAGTDGLAGPSNEREAIKSGTAIPAPPGEGIKVEPQPRMERTEPPKPQRQ